MTVPYLLYCIMFFFNDTPTTHIYTLSLHDALPISVRRLHPLARRDQHEEVDRDEHPSVVAPATFSWAMSQPGASSRRDRKSTRLNSSHLGISYAVFCLKKKKKKMQLTCRTYKRAVC